MSANQCHRLASETEEERAARLQQMSANQCHRLHWRRKWGGARGAAASLNAGHRGLCPPTNLCQWVSETRCEIKLPAVIHSGMAQKRIESFFALAPRRTATVVQGKLALPGSCACPDCMTRGGVACVVQLHALLH